MPRVSFTENIQRHVSCPPRTTDGATVLECLEAVFAHDDRLRGYVLDDQGGLRQHMAVFIDGQMIRDRGALSDAVGPDSDVWVMQALSGG